MKTIKGTFLLLIASTVLLSTQVSAETIYISELLKHGIRSGPSHRNKILQMLTSGSSLTVLSKDAATGYTKVRTKKGLIGYILTRYTQKSPVSRFRIKQNNKKLEKIEIKNQQLTEELTALKTDNQANSSNNTLLTTEREQLARELQELKQTASSAIQIKQQRDQLQERVVNIERENQQLKRDKQGLEYTSKQDWFLNGGIVAFLGIFLGLLIPKISWQKSRRRWDTF